MLISDFVLVKSAMCDFYGNANEVCKGCPAKDGERCKVSIGQMRDVKDLVEADAILMKWLEIEED